MISRIALGIAVGIIVSLLCTFVGGLLITVEIPWVVAVGVFLHGGSSLLGFAAALWYAVVGYAHWPRNPQF